MTDVHTQTVKAAGGVGDKGLIEGVWVGGGAAITSHRTRSFKKCNQILLYDTVFYTRYIFVAPYCAKQVVFAYAVQYISIPIKVGFCIL